MRRLRLNQTGDTIVEVLLVTLILGLVLSGSYAIASRSLKSIRQAQERGEALKLAEGQLESIKSAAAQEIADVTTTNNVFCLDMPTSTNVHQFSGASTVTQPITNDDFSRYPSQCVRGLYHIAAERTEVDGRSTYTVFVRWDSIGLIGREEVILRYRLAEETN